MKNLILYFSATGNTARLAGIVRAALEEAGEEVRTETMSARAPCPIGADGFDRLVVAFPVLAKMPPALVQRCLRRLPTGRRENGGRVQAVALATEGDKGGPAALRAASILKRRGYDVSLSARIRYASNWTEVGAVPGDDEEASKATASGDARARELARKIISGSRESDRVSAGAWLLGQILGFLFGVFGRRFLGKLFVADERCKGCGLCARTCPSATIVMEGGPKPRPFWRMNCENCNRCINACPERAINTSLLGIALQLASIGLFRTASIGAVNELLWPLLAPAFAGIAASAVHALLIVAAFVCAFFFSLGPADFFVYRRIRCLPILRKAFGLSFSRGFRRYLAPGFKAGSCE